MTNEERYQKNLGFKVPVPEKGQKIYVHSSLYVYRGEDDFAGGIATINKVEFSDFLPEDHYNYTMVGIEERPGTMYNWCHLFEEQEKLKEMYGDQIAHPDPDDRPEFNEGDDADWVSL